MKFVICYPEDWQGDGSKIAVEMKDGYENEPVLLGLTVRDALVKLRRYKEAVDDDGA